jgi:hypothetical protein
MGRMSPWKVFNFRGDPTIPKSIHALMMLEHISYILGVYLAIAGRRQPINPSVPRQKPRVPQKLISIGEENNLKRYM